MTKHVDVYGLEARTMKPTKAHRPLIWSGLLGTVIARNPQGEVKYFDYDLGGAKAFAEVDENEDLRLASLPANHRIDGADSWNAPHIKQPILWGKRSS